MKKESLIWMFKYILYDIEDKNQPFPRKDAFVDLNFPFLFPSDMPSQTYNMTGYHNESIAASPCKDSEESACSICFR